MRPASVRLSPTFDGHALAAEVRTLHDLTRSLTGPWEAKGWDGIALIQAEGRAEDARSPVPSRSGPLPTPALARCPLLREALAAIPGPILAARLLYLEPGGSAALHRDAIGFPVGGVRLHLPIMTHPDVELWLGGERTHWQPGELWFGDFAFPHRLANPTSITRVHLVVDVCITHALYTLFPEAVLPELLALGACLSEPATRLTAEALGVFVGRWHVPRGLFHGVPAPEDLSFAFEDGAIVARGPDGETALHLDPVSSNKLTIRGYYPGLTFERRGERVALVHRGRVTFSDYGRKDDEDMPWDLTTTEDALERL